MSRSLSRVRNLISEIEEIQRQGQQGARGSMNVISEPLMGQAPVVAIVPPVQEAPQEPVVEVSTPVSQVRPEVDPFEGLSRVVDLDSRRPEVQSIAPQPGKIFVQLSGQVALQLKIEDSSEVLELKQLGDILEIRFADGKAFHLPINSVA